MAFERFQVSLRSVTLVPVESIDREFLGQFPHPSVTTDLCNDTCRCDRKTDAVSLDNPLRRKRKTGNIPAVNEAERWPAGKRKRRSFCA